MSLRVLVAQALARCNPSRQTLLHLSAILGFHRLMSGLLVCSIDVDACDMNGYTALHFAALFGR